MPSRGSRCELSLSNACNGTQSRSEEGHGWYIVPVPRLVPLPPPRGLKERRRWLSRGAFLCRQLFPRFGRAYLAVGIVSCERQRTIGFLRSVPGVSNRHVKRRRCSSRMLPLSRSFLLSTHSRFLIAHEASAVRGAKVRPYASCNVFLPAPRRSFHSARER